jgi:hypothetical protein
MSSLLKSWYVETLNPGPWRDRIQNSESRIQNSEPAFFAEHSARRRNQLAKGLNSLLSCITPSIAPEWMRYLYQTLIGVSVMQGSGAGIRKGIEMPIYIGLPRGGLNRI